MIFNARIYNGFWIFWMEKYEAYSRIVVNLLHHLSPELAPDIVFDFSLISLGIMLGFPICQMVDLGGQASKQNINCSIIKHFFPHVLATNWLVSKHGHIVKRKGSSNGSFKKDSLCSEEWNPETNQMKPNWTVYEHKFLQKLN